ncbi:MAG: glycosyltransferase family 87 protein [Myxococcota bacterium]
MVVVAAVLWHVLAVFGPPRQPPPPDTEGRDFASYYYAAAVAAAGDDPYDKRALEARAKSDGTRAEVHPFFYPPPFLWLVTWSTVLPLRVAFWVWFAVNELALVATAALLVRWWRPLDPLVAPVLATVIAAAYAVQYSAELGQVNFPVLLLVVCGLMVEARRPGLAGVLVGLACMFKMSPALFVLWWVVRGRWTAVGAAVATAIGSSILTLPLVGLGTQLEFYTRVLPKFGSGDYNGLTVKIEMFGNHSLPNLWHLYFPSGKNVLSTPARLLSGLSTVAVVGGALAAFARPTSDPVRLAAQAGAVLVAMLLVPVYTYEHHLVFAIPAIVFAVLAVHRGWLSERWLVPIALAVPVLLFDLAALRQLDLKLVTVERPVLYIWVEEAKFAALLVIGAAMLRIGGTTWEDRSRPPPPLPLG